MRLPGLLRAGWHGRAGKESGDERGEEGEAAAGRPDGRLGGQSVLRPVSWGVGMLGCSMTSPFWRESRPEEAKLAFGPAVATPPSLPLILENLLQGPF